MAEAPGATMCSWSGSGAPSSTRRYTSRPTIPWPRHAIRSPVTSAFTTPADPIRALTGKPRSGLLHPASADRGGLNPAGAPLISRKICSDKRSHLTPPVHRTPHGQSAGTRHSDPGKGLRPQFRCHQIPFDASSVVHFRSSLQSIHDVFISRLLTVTLPSRPGEFHPEPLTEPDLRSSRVPASCRLRRY